MGKTNATFISYPLYNERVQLMRALAIICVVMIHTSPGGIDQVFIRPFINLCVALFIFLSGYLTQFGHEKIGEIYRKRVSRVLIPYLIWTAVYTFAYHGSVWKLFLNILSGNAAAQMYFIPVYIQFVLLTPFIRMWIQHEKFKWLGWLVSPISVILFVYLPTFSGIPLYQYMSAFWHVSCLGWFLFYYLGLLLGNGHLKINLSIKKLALLYAGSIVVQMVEGYLFYWFGNANCGTQLKFSAYLSSALFCLIAYKYISSSPKAPSSILGRIILSLGSCSFGIYLSHIFVMGVLGHVFHIYKSISFCMNSVIVVLISWLAVLIGRRMVGKKIGKLLGLY